MKRMHATAAMAALVCCGLIAPVRAAPPTVTPSPGYDARLAEQRRASTVYLPGPRLVRRRHHSKRAHQR